MARLLMDRHGLTDWSFSFDRAKRRAGSCRHIQRRITLSAPLCCLYEEHLVRDIVLHEIAHALVGPTHSHDQVWKAKAREIGATPAARVDPKAPVLQGEWEGRCPRCGAVKFLFSSPRRVVSCGVCSPVFDPALVLEWSNQTGGGYLGKKYVRELRRARL